MELMFVKLIALIHGRISELCCKKVGYSLGQLEKISKWDLMSIVEEHILKICQIAGVDDFVGAHPKGHDLEIKERGVGFQEGKNNKQ